MTKVDELLTITTREKQSFRSVEPMLSLDELELTDDDLERERERRFDLKEKPEKFEIWNIWLSLVLLGSYKERNGLGVLDKKSKA